MFSLRNKRRLMKKSVNLNKYGPFFIIFPLPVMLKFTVHITAVHLTLHLSNKLILCIGGGGGVAPSKCLKVSSLGTVQKRKGARLFFWGYSKIRKMKNEQKIANNLEF